MPSSVYPSTFGSGAMTRVRLADGGWSGWLQGVNLRVNDHGQTEVLDGIMWRVVA